jgi:hypothetical protein
MSNQTEIPADIQELWGEPPILTSEDPKLYVKLAIQIASTVGPEDVIEWFLVKDILDLTWETLRLRRIKVGMVERGRRHFRNYVLKGLTVTGDEKALNKHFIEDRVTAVAFDVALPIYERIETLLVGIEFRRMAVLREFDRRRDSFASRLRRASDDIINGEFTEHRAGGPIPRRAKRDRLMPEIANRNSKPSAA